MKRYTCLILAACICFSLFGCGSPHSVAEPPVDTEPVQTTSAEVGQIVEMEEATQETEAAGSKIIEVELPQLKTEASDALVFDPETMNRIYLTATEEMSVRDYKAAVETVRNRLDVLTDGDEYFLEVYEDTVEIWLPKTCLQGENVDYVISAYIGCAGELSLFDKKDELSLELNKIDLYRKDIRELNLRQGTIEGLDAKQHGITEDTYSYLEIVLTDNCANRIGIESLKNWKNLSLGQDYALSSGYYMPAVLQKDERTLLVLNSDQKGKFLETMLHNYQNEALADSFYIEIEASVNWEDPEDAFVAGENQCREDELTGKTVTVFYHTYDITDVKSGEWVDTCTGLKQRLDQLGVPYAVGILEEGDSLGIAYKTDPSRMSRGLMDIMGSGNYSVNLRIGLKSLNLYDAEAEIIEKEDGGYAFKLDVSQRSYEKNKLAEFTKDCPNDQELVLYAGDYPVFSTYCDGTITDGILLFENLYFNYHAEMDEDNLWVAKLMEVLINGNMGLLFYDNHEYGMDEDGNMASSKDFGLHYQEYEQKMRRAVEKHAVNAYIGSDGSTLKVFMDLDVDDTLPKTAATVVKDIYNSMDFENTHYSNVYFYLLEEDESKGERARIFFSKYGNEVHVSGVFKNGRIDQYYDMFLYYLRSDPFYYDKVDDFYNTWR